MFPMPYSPTWRPMPLLRVAEAFDHPAWVFELKHDGFRALAVVDRYASRLISRGGHDLKHWPSLTEEIAHAVRADRVVLDGEITCVQPDGRSDFRALLFRRAWPVFYAFDVLAIGGEDLRGLPFLERKARLRAVMPRIETRLRYVDHLVGRRRRPVPSRLRARHRGHRCQMDPRPLPHGWADNVVVQDQESELLPA